MGNKAKQIVNSTPVDVHTDSTDDNPLSDIIAIDLGDNHSCALTEDEEGKVKCAGELGLKIRSPLRHNQTPNLC